MKIRSKNSIKKWFLLILGFSWLSRKSRKRSKETGLNEAIVTGTAELDGVKYGIAVMDSRFRMGSMGSVVGKKSVESLIIVLNIGYHLYYFLQVVVPECKKVLFH